MHISNPFLLLLILPVLTSSAVVFYQDPTDITVCIAGFQPREEQVILHAMRRWNRVPYNIQQFRPFCGEGTVGVIQNRPAIGLITGGTYQHASRKEWDGTEIMTSFEIRLDAELLRFPQVLYNVALHELGHALQLSHPVAGRDAVSHEPDASIMARGIDFDTTGDGGVIAPGVWYEPSKGDMFDLWQVSWAYLTRIEF